MVNQMWVQNQVPNHISNSNLNWGTTIMPMAGTGGLTANQGIQGPVFEGPKIHFRKKSRFMKALSNCQYGKSSDGNIARNIDSYFRDQTLGGLLPAMDFNPMYNGRPRREILPLLLCAPTPMKFFHQHVYWLYGLVTSEPAICNRRKTRARLSYAGLELLDYWGEKYPKFKPFVDAYVPIKARKEIAVDAVGYRLGIVPSRFLKMKELHEKEMAKNRDTPNRRKYAQKLELQKQALLAQQAQYYQQAPQMAVMPMWAQQAMLQNQQAQLMGMAPPVYSNTATTIAANDTSAAAYLGSAIGKLLGRK